MNRRPRQHGALNALAHETADPQPGVWWLSFADGDHWLGGCYIEAIGPAHAVARTHELGINPGGEVLITGALSRERFDQIAPATAVLDRLLQKEDIDDLIPVEEDE
jgi:hypothetical protein